PPVAAPADRVAGLGAPEVVEQPAAVGREVARLAVIAARRELKDRVRARDPRAREHDQEAQSHSAPSRIQRSIAAISAGGSGRSGGIVWLKLPRSHAISGDVSGWPGS